VDNLSGANILGRIISVDHHRYKHKEDEEAEAEKEATAAARGDIASRDRDEDRRKWRKRDADEEAAPRREPTKKERELMELMRDVDNDDPMKEYMIQQKKDELEAEKALVEAKKKRRKDKECRDRDKDRHRHRHQYRSRSRSPGRHRSRSRSECGRTSEPAEDMRRKRSQKREGAHERDRSSRSHRPRR